MVARWLCICMCIGGEVVSGTEKTISKGPVTVVAFGGREEGFWGKAFASRRGMNNMA